MDLAVRKNDYDALKKLLRKGAKIDAENENGATLLHRAAYYGRAGIVELLMENGADVLKVTRDKGNSALHIAVLKRNVGVVEVLLGKTSRDQLRKLLDTKTKKSRSTALHVAVKINCYEIVKMLLINGAIYDAEDNDGKRPIDLSNGETTVLLSIIDANFSSMAFLEVKMLKAMLRVLPLEEYLCANNCRRNDEDLTILQVALKESRLDIVYSLTSFRTKYSRFFPQTNALALDKLEACLNIDGRPLENILVELRKFLGAFSAYESEVNRPIRVLNVRSIEELVEFYERVVDLRGLFESRSELDSLVCAALLILGLPIFHVKQAIFTSKLLIAAYDNELAEVERCLANNARVNAQQDDKDKNASSSLHLAAVHGNANMARVLLDWHANPTIKDGNGNMPLHVAALNNRVNVVELLLERNGQLVNLTGNKQWTALQHATKAGHLDAVKCLMKYAAFYEIPIVDMPFSKVIPFLALIDKLFDMVALGNNEVVRKLRTLERDELMAVTKTRNELGFNLQQQAIVTKNKTIADEIARIVNNRTTKKNKLCKR